MSKKMLFALNFSLLIVLGLFAKDSLIAEVRHWLSSDQNVLPALKSEGTIEVAFSPNKGATAAIIRAIGEAKKTILVSAYSFTHKDIAKALLNAKKRGVDVKIILDKSQVNQRYSSSSFFDHQEFSLKIDVKHAIFHNKVMIIDETTVITGSFNFTKSAEARNAENVLIIRGNASLAKLYTENWWMHWHQSVTINEFRTR